MGFYNPKTVVDSAGEDATQAQKHARGELFFAHSTVLRFVTDDGRRFFFFSVFLFPNRKPHQCVRNTKEKKTPKG
jgi:hypothetical protein